MARKYLNSTQPFNYSTGIRIQCNLTSTYNPYPYSYQPMPGLYEEYDDEIVRCEYCKTKNNVKDKHCDACGAPL